MRRSMKRPSPPRQRRRTKHTNPERNKANNISNKTTTTHSLTVNNHFSETNDQQFKAEVILISSSHQTTSKGFNDNTDPIDYDSTASTPKQRSKQAGKKVAATERRDCKYKLNIEVGSTSEPPKFKLLPTGTGLLCDSQYHKLKKNLFCQPEEEDDNDFYINFHPNTTVGYEGFDTGVAIPDWMPMTFPPLSKMNLNDICAYTCAYIFRRDSDEENGDELLVRTTSGVFGDRATLNSLVPRTAVDEGIINLVVARVNWMIDGIGKTKSVWFFPTQFSQYALNPNYTAEYVTKLYRDKFMSTKSSVTKIFIPLNDQGIHWYLLVVDFLEKKLVWLDSLPSDERHNKRRHVILKVAMFVEEMLEEDCFAELRPHFPDRLITKFCLDEPAVPRQRLGSKDCGVWVAKWMIECPFQSNYDKVTVVTASRMKLALYLVHSANNLLLEDVVAKAADYWAAMEKRRKKLVII